MRYATSLDAELASAVKSNLPEYREARQRVLNSILGSGMPVKDKEILIGQIGIKDAARVEYLLEKRELSKKDIFDIVNEVAREAQDYVFDLTKVAEKHDNFMKLRGEVAVGRHDEKYMRRMHDEAHSRDVEALKTLKGLKAVLDLIENKPTTDAGFYKGYARVEKRYATQLERLVGEEVI